MTGATLETNPVLKIRNETRKIIIGHVLIPKLKKLKELQSFGKTHIAKDELLTVDPQEELAMTEFDESTGATMNPLLRTLDAVEAKAARESSVGASFDADYQLKTELKEGETAPTVETASKERVWREIVLLVEEGKDEEAAAKFYVNVEEVVRNGGMEVSIDALIYLCTAVSPSPVITSQQKKELFELIANDSQGRLSKVYSRTMFIGLVKNTTRRNPKSQLASLDLMKYALYLFPKASGTVEGDILVDLIHATTSPSEHHSFSASYVKMKASQQLDFLDFLIFLPFVVLYLSIVLTGKGLAPRSFHSHNLNSAFRLSVYDAEFHSDCNRTYSPMTGLVTSTGCDATTSFESITSPDDTYGFLNGPILDLWGSEPLSIAAENDVNGNVKLVGALKVRAVRGLGTADPDYWDYFGPDQKTNSTYLPQADRSAALRYSVVTTESTDKRPIPGVDHTSLLTAVRSKDGTAMNGFHYTSCDQANASQGIWGSRHWYNCDGHSLIIPFNATRAEAQQLLHQLEENSWIDFHTSAVIVDFFAFHPASTMLASQRMLIEFNLGGAGSTRRHNRPFALHNAATNTRGAEAAWIVFVVYLLFLILRLIFRSVGNVFSCCGTGPSAAFARYSALKNLTSSGWMIFDIINYALFVIHFGYRLRWISVGIPASDPVWQVDHYPMDYELAAWDFNVLIHIDTFNVILMILSVLRYTQYIHGLDIVIRTLMRSGQDCAAVFIVTVGVFFGFVITAYSVWGDSLENYGTFYNSFITVAVINELMWDDIYAEQPLFAGFFFFCYYFIMLACLLNMLIAVFSEAYNDVKEATFDRTSALSIFSNNPRRALTSTSKTFWKRLHLIQLPLASIKNGCCCRDKDIYNYADYYAQLMSDLRVLLLPFQVLVRTGEVNEDRMVDDSVECLQYRLDAAERLLDLVDKYVPPSQVPVTNVAEGTQTIYEYMMDLFQDFDFYLIFSLFVLVPQNKFDLSGRDLLMDSASSFTKWRDKVDDRTSEPSDVDLLQVEVETTLLSDLAPDIGDPDDEEEAEDDPLAGLGRHSRFVLYGLLAFADEKDLQNNATYTNELFLDLFSRDPMLETDLTMCGEDVWEMVQASEMQDIPLRAIHAYMQEFFAVRTYSFLWTVHEIRSLEEFVLELRSGTRKDLLEAEEPKEASPSLPTTTTAEEQKKDEEPAEAQKEGEAAAAEESTIVIPIEEDQTQAEAPLEQEETEETRPSAIDIASEPTNDGTPFSATPQITLKETPALDERKHCEIFDDTMIFVDRTAFKEAWKRGKGSEVAPSALEQIFSTANNGKINLLAFLRFCNANPWAHFRKDFSYFFAQTQSEAASFLFELMTWLLILILLCFFLLAGTQLGETIHVTRSLHGAFDPRESGVKSLGEVRDWIEETVIPNMWAGNDTEGATTLGRYNFYVGALRIRQRRVTSRKDGRCALIFNQFFGDGEGVNPLNPGETDEIVYPPAMDTVSRAFYQQRIARDFSDLQRHTCYGAYDFGFDSDESPFNPLTNASLLSPNVEKAFHFYDFGQYGGADDIEAHDATYSGGGYSLLLPFQQAKNETVFQLRELFDNGWMNNRTRFVVVEFFVFNYNLLLFTKVRYGFEITAAGGFWPIVEVGVSAAPEYSSPHMIILILIFWILFAMFIVAFLTDVIQSVKTIRQYLGSTIIGAIFTSFRHSWVHTLDLTIISFAIASWILRAVGFNALSQFETVRNNGQYPSGIELTVRTGQNSRKLESVLLMLAFLRTFYFVRFIKRLQIIFITFARAAKDLLSIMILFVLGLVAFALAGMVLYGYQLEQFYSFSRSLLSLFLHVQGENDFDDMLPARPEVTGVFSHVLTIILDFVLFNLITGVLTDTFGDVKNSIYDVTAAKSILAKHIKDDRKKKPLSQRIKNALISSTLFLEGRYAIDMVRHFFKPPLECKARNPRKLWQLLMNWQKAMDIGTPRESILGSVMLLHVGQVSIPRHHDHCSDSTNSLEVNLAASLRRSRANFGISDAASFHLRKKRKLRTYGIGRLPLWEEYLFTVLGSRVKHTLQWYYVQPPNHFIESISMPVIWLDALEQYYYYQQDKEQYSGENQDPAAQALSSITGSLEAAAARAKRRRMTVTSEAGGTLSLASPNSDFNADTPRKPAVSYTPIHRPGTNPPPEDDPAVVRASAPPAGGNRNSPPTADVDEVHNIE